MPRKDSSYKASVWDKSLILTICGVLTVGILYGLNQLLADEPGADDSSFGSGGSGDGDE
jgi:hypothetical protein